MHRKPRQRWKPAGAITVLDKERLGTVFLYSHRGAPAAVAYRGRCTRPELHITSASPTMLETSVRRWFDGLRNRAQQVALHRQLRQQDEWSRNNVIRNIKRALKSRGMDYSVRGGRGTAWGWIHVDLLPSVDRLLTPDKRREAYVVLNRAFGLDLQSGQVTIPASSAHYREYLERARGLKPTKIAQPYWD